MNTNCPWCNAPIAPGPKCPKCGAIYAKAAAIRLHGRADLTDDATAPDSGMHSIVAFEECIDIVGKPAVANPTLEWKFCVTALPLALILGLLFHASSLGHFL